MYIAHLSLRDFKSFGGERELPLSPGLSAIVGPNGCGKSNLLDALRFALGEGAPSRLRISRLADLIFQGSASRGRAESAEVGLQFRQELRTATVRRRLGGEGTSQVLLDGRRATLQELESAKRAFGLEGERFAFIGQGEVTDVISCRPAARRMQLEALFGIDVYRLRREEAGARLLAAEEEMRHLRRLSAELAARRETIAPEVARAREARAILDEMEELRGRAYHARRRRAEELIRLAGETRSRLEAEIARSAWYEGAYAAALEGAEAARRTVEALRAERSGLREEMRGRRDALARERIASASSYLSALRRNRSLQSERREALRGEETNRAERIRTAARRETLAAEREEVASREHLLEERYRALRSEIERRRAVRDAALDEAARIEVERRTLAGRLAALGRRRHEMEGVLRAVEARRVEAEDALAAAERVARQAEEDFGAAAARERERSARSTALAAELQKRRKEWNVLVRRLEETADAAGSQVHPRPVQYLLSALRLGRLDVPILPVLDAFDSPARIAQALEAYLGGRTSWLLVSRMEEAGRCIERLKSAQAGRATFLPLERCRPRFPDRGARLPGAGIVGWAIDLIRPREEWRPAVEHLLGDLLIVESYAVGQGLVRSGFRGPLATLEGDVFQPAGSVSGGKSSGGGRAIETKALLAELEERAAEAKERVDRLAGELAASEEEGERLQADREEAERALRGAREDLARCRSEASAARSESEGLRTERTRVDEGLSDAGRAWRELGRREREAERPVEEVGSVEVPEGLAEDLAAARSERALAEERLRSLDALIVRMDEEARERAERLERIDREERETARTVDRERETLCRIARESRAARRAETEAEREIRETEEAIRRCRGRIDRIERRRDRIRSRREVLHREAREASQEMTDLRREVEELIGLYEENHPYPGEENLPAEEDPEELRRTLKERERTLRGLGETDLGLLSEDRSLADRLAFLTDQMDDCRGGIAELERLIAEADRRAQEAFERALRSIDERFDALFRRLFGGGEAHLELVPGETLWTSGVDIAAYPPGKRSQGLAQLSGGERSLAAIAFLFAAAETARSPLLVLDEVDAALDEVNLRRFAELAREFAVERQIIVITHRRVTMERADLLYGVTLEEPGLSQIVGVRLEDWA